MSRGIDADLAAYLFPNLSAFKNRSPLSIEHTEFTLRYFIQLFKLLCVFTINISKIFKLVICNALKIKI